MDSELKESDCELKPLSPKTESLKNHLDIHVDNSRDKRCTCYLPCSTRVCGREFCGGSTLNRYMRMHAGQKLYISVLVVWKISGVGAVWPAMLEHILVECAVSEVYAASALIKVVHCPTTWEWILVLEKNIIPVVNGGRATVTKVH